MRKEAFVAWLLLAGCAPTVAADLFVSPDLVSRSPSTYLILPFESRIPAREASRHPDAGEILTDAFETAFLETGARLVERGRIKAILSEQAFSASGLTEEDSVKIGRLLSADAVIVGVVTSYHKGGFGSPATTVGVTVKAIDVTSGAILWKGNGAYTGATMGANYSVDPTVAAQGAAKRLIEEFLKKRGAQPVSAAR
jgi:hypothetical protein